MSLSLLPSRTAIKTSMTQPFLGTGGTPPYTYSVVAGGAGGTIDVNGIYTSPLVTGLDVVQVQDSLGAIALSDVLIGSPLELLCDILQTRLGLAAGRVFIWDQKINSPNDFGLYIAVSALAPKPFSNKSVIDPDTGNEIQSVNMHVNCNIDLISRDTSALDRKEEVIMALNSIYSRQQQGLNSFRVFPLSNAFQNLSNIDGAAIPYRYNISVNIQYFTVKSAVSEYYNDFSLADPDVKS